MNIYALIAALLGCGAGVYFALRYQRYLVHLVQAHRLAADKPYTDRLARKLLRPEFYRHSVNTYNFRPYEQHEHAVEYAQPFLFASIRDEYALFGKTVILQAVRLGTIPLAISFVAGVGVAFTCSILITVIALTLYEALYVQKSSGSYDVHTALVTQHVYAIADYRYGQSRSQTAAQQQATPIVYSVTDQAPTVKEDANRPHDAMPDKHDQALDWKKIWWGNDIALCVILVVLFWLTNFQSIPDALSSALQIIVITQLFFIPIWVVITITLRLLAKYY